MMAAALQQLSWRDSLPALRGKLVPDAPLGAYTWFRVGGPADLLFIPDDADDLAVFLAALPAEVPVTVIGVGSNLLVRDGGIRGAVIRLGAGLGKVAAEEGNRVRAGAAALDVAVARKAAEAGIAGLEFLSGIPGSIGGALRMNAGAYGGELKDVLIEAVAIARDGTRVTMSLEDFGYGYRHSSAPQDLIFVEALLQGAAGDGAAIRARMDEIAQKRGGSQPIKSRTGGSTFKNPPGAHAWQLIDAAGCRGLRMGDAQVSEQHCNFLINLGNASAADLEALGEEVRRRVNETQGVMLDWEIKRIGEATDAPAREGTP